MGLSNLTFSVYMHISLLLEGSGEGGEIEGGRRNIILVWRLLDPLFYRIDDVKLS
jgi:hypothetical protein